MNRFNLKRSLHAAAFTAALLGLGSSLTACVPLMLGGVASAIAGATDNAAGKSGTDCSAISAGALTVMDTRGFNNLAGAEVIFTDREAPVVSIDQTFTVALVGTPTTLTSWYGTLTFEELT